ncbi:MAG TPA: serine hydrolase domain-containing protein [Mucilaginibacter sp.]
MKIFFLLCAVLLFTAISLKAQNISDKNCGIDISVNDHYSKSDSLHSIMKRYIKAGIPGVAMALYTEKEGWWAGAEGYASMETKKLMDNCNLQYLQSVSKSYMAVAILQLHEQGKIDLDAPTTKYLPLKYAGYIKNPGDITVRMLLNHTSGIPEYSDDPAFVSYVVQHPLQKLTTEFVIGTIKNKEPMFAPGSKHHYSNTNYELLAVIADAITGDHAAYIQKNIFKKLGLKNTFYRNDPNYLHYHELVDSYWDVLNTGRPANITAMQKANVSSYIGDDGIVCTPVDAVKFLKGLMEGKLLSETSVNEMKKWVNDDKGKPVYGLGLEYFEAGGIEAYGHSGGGVGAGCILLYIPAVKTYIFLATNIGTLFEGSLPAKAGQLKDELLMTVLQ